MNIHSPLSYLSEFLEEYPLYSKFGINQPAEPPDLNGIEFNFLCNNEKEFHVFKLEAASNYNGRSAVVYETTFEDQSGENIRIDFTEIFIGTCQSCNAYKINIIISGGSQKEKPRYFLRKIGQYPAPESNTTKVPKDVFNFLNIENRNLYQKALKNLEMGSGAGALVYFQKIAEKEFSRILELVSNPYSPDSNKITDAFGIYKIGQQRSRLIDEITPHLPENLKEHGANILLVLHDAPFISIHELTEEDCIKKSKDIDTLFRHLVRKLNKQDKKTGPVVPFH